MPYTFPADLADQVLARWTTFVARHDRPAPPLPPVEALRYILETAFFASFAREEGRSLRFALCCAVSTPVPRDGAGDPVPVIPFVAPRPLTVQQIRSLAPAVSPANAAILVVCPPGGSCQIAGVLNVGSNLTRARRGGSLSQGAAPYALVVDVRDAGELHIYRGSIKLATLKSGSLQDQLAFSELEFLPISDILTRGVDVIRPRLIAPAHEPPPETSDFEWAALLNTILSIVNGLELHGHGGTLLVTSPGKEHTLPVHMKFDVDERNSMLPDRFAAFVNARHALVGARLARKRRLAGAESESALSHLQDSAAIAEEDLASATDLTARLSAVDGALVLSSDLRVLGFGAEIVVDASRPIVAYEVSGHVRRLETWPTVDAESFGMRHGSALRGVASSSGTAAFVVSQDGAVSFFWKESDRVLVKRGVTIAIRTWGDKVAPPAPGVHGFSVESLDGEIVSLNRYEGQVLLIVNVASQCGYTPQYEGLQRLYRKYAEAGFSVLGFPCNQFGRQEPGSAAEIQAFCSSSYQITFPLFSKVEVNGPGAHPLFRYLKAQKRGPLGVRAIVWNFTKFLIGRDGEVLARFGPTRTPAQIEAVIAQTLTAATERSS